MGPTPSLPDTLKRLEALVQERNLRRSELLDPQELAARTALPEDTVRLLLRGGEAPPDTVNDRVRARIRSLADAYLARTGVRMSELANRISRQLGVSAFWARQVCTGEKVPSVELLHGLVEFFGVEGGEAFFTVPSAEALHRALLPVLASLQPGQDGPDPGPDPLAAVLSGHGDVRGVALRRARDLPEERWHVLSATLNALLELDEREGDA
ncbi:hypothetical protein [Streptomyces antimicrobicus]|uniref:Transcriptional regulator n=1 Tax=Streptomyces antimicrobicus TaxID=2883108 RepID=A0ABS8B553_9ACTN|nr:hypothetical protein [Streptomyces antimicrobicus]MCB5179727.1 hypothetical protein [Streptomyces antimicrobicus]